MQLFDKTTGEGRNADIPMAYSFYNGSHADFIDERVATEYQDYMNECLTQLANFGVAHWAKVKVETVSGKWKRLGEVTRLRDIMGGEEGTNVMATPSSIGSDKKSFEDEWKHCHP